MGGGPGIQPEHLTLRYSTVQIQLKSGRKKKFMFYIFYYC